MSGIARSLLLPILLNTAVNVSARLVLEPLVGQDSFLTVWCLITTAHLLAAPAWIGWIHGQLGRNTIPQRAGPRAQ